MKWSRNLQLSVSWTSGLCQLTILTMTHTASGTERIYQIHLKSKDIAYIYMLGPLGGPNW
jgi:hypothetical protein